MHSNIELVQSSLSGKQKLFIQIKIPIYYFQMILVTPKKDH